MIFFSAYILLVIILVKFTKIEGTGNNYIYIDLITNDYKIYNYSDLAKKISDYNFGIGSDGLILILPSKIADAKMLIFNKDGSEGKMCGNGIRGVALYINKFINKKEVLNIETKSGIKTVKLNNNNIIVNMGKPIIKCSKIPLYTEKNRIINEKIIIDNINYNINCVSMGNPHTVIFLDNITNIDIKKMSEQILKLNIFPNKTNIEFVEIINKRKIKLRVYEIGSEETLSCGTGACASVVAGVLNNFLDKHKRIEVIVPGGTLYITYNKTVILEGPSHIICEGNFYYSNKK